MASDCNATQRFALAIHGGAGTIEQDSLDVDTRARYEQALRSALEPGRPVLERAGHALDAVEACVRALEDDVFEVEVEPDIAEGARRSLERMLAVPRDH